MDRKARALALIAPRLLGAGLLTLALGAADPLAASAPQRAARPPAARTDRWPLLTLTSPDVEARDPELARVRDRLRAAIAARDLQAVRAIFAPTVRDQDAAVAADDVLATMGPLVPGQPLSDEWQALDAALRLGGTRLGDAYVVPFTASAATGRANAANEVFVAGLDVPVRDNPAGAGVMVTRLSNAIVRAALVSDVQTPSDASGCRTWTAIESASATVGWVCAADTRPMVGLYYAFERIDEAWRLTALWAADAAR
jgi:hypothetical protein